MHKPGDKVKIKDPVTGKASEVTIKEIKDYAHMSVYVFIDDSGETFGISANKVKFV
jgi:hypothetical protein